MNPKPLAISLFVGIIRGFCLICPMDTIHFSAWQWSISTRSVPDNLHLTERKFLLME
jgi:hypothetical protein